MTGFTEWASAQRQLEAELRAAFQLTAPEADFVASVLRPWGVPLSGPAPSRRLVRTVQRGGKRLQRTLKRDGREAGVLEARALLRRYIDVAQSYEGYVCSDGGLALHWSKVLQDFQSGR